MKMEVNLRSDLTFIKKRHTKCMYTPQKRAIVISIFLGNNLSVAVEQREFKRRYPGYPTFTRQTIQRLLA